jgi:ankyrin repeat protein
METDKLYKLATQIILDEWQDFLTNLSTATIQQIKYKRWNDDNTILHVLCQRNAPIHVVKAVIDAGADVHARENSAGFTPLHDACLNSSSAELVQLLLDNGLNPNLRNNMGMTALHMACKRGVSSDFVITLLHGGANPDITCNGMKPIDYAREFEYLDLVKILANWPPIKAANFLS